MPRDNFQIIGSHENVQIIAIKHSIRDLKFLERMYGQGRWRKLKGIAKVQLENGRIRLAEMHWYEARHRQTPDENQEIFGLTMKDQDPNHRIAICVDDTDYEMSLERRKVYPILPDADAERDDYVRIIDETGEDYLFPASRFVFLTVPTEVEAAVLAKA